MSSSRKCAGRLFQTRGPAAAKLLSPNVLCVHGTAHDLSVDERSRRLGPSETKCMSSAKYGGALLDNDEKTKACQFEVDTSLDREPVQLTQNWRDMFRWEILPVIFTGYCFFVGTHWHPAIFLQMWLRKFSTRLGRFQYSRSECRL